jgi:hypothetical protein
MRWWVGIGRAEDGGEENEGKDNAKDDVDVATATAATQESAMAAWAFGAGEDRARIGL